MKKVRSNARWNGLSARQRATLEVWLFEDGVGYEEALRRACMELGFQGSVSSLKRFYVRRSQERVLEKLVETQEDAEAIEAAPATAGLFRSAAMKLVGQLFFRQVREMPGEVKEWSALAKLMLWQEDLELRRQLKREENEIRRENLAFARERFQFNVVRQAEKALPQLQELAEARKDPKLKEYEEAKRMNEIKRTIFGSDLPDWSIDPENAEEEAAKEEEARKKQAEEASQAARVRQESMARRPAEVARPTRTNSSAEGCREEKNAETQEDLAEEEQMVEISRAELARMAQPRAVVGVVEEPVKNRMEEPVKLRPTCMTYQEWEKEQEGKRAAGG